MATKRLIIPMVERTQYPVSFGTGVKGEPEYLIKEPKMTYSATIAARASSSEQDAAQMVEVMVDWVFKAFGKKQGEAIKKRLYDDEDDLDLKHIMELIQMLSEEATGDPTT